MISLKNIESNMISFSPDQAVAYLDCRWNDCCLPCYTIFSNIPSMQDNIYMAGKMLHDTLSPETLQKVETKEGEIPPHRMIQKNNYIDSSGKTKHNQYPWMEKDKNFRYGTHRLESQSQRFMIDKKWKAKVHDLLKEYCASF